jgi:acyl-CoA thioester hydrolase
MLGHVNNAVYQHYYDYARMEYFSEVLGNHLNWKEFGVIMAGISINYYHPVNISDSIGVRSSITKIGDKSITMVQEIYNTLSGVVCSANEATMVGFSSILNESQTIPDYWRNRISTFEGKVGMKHPV